MHIGSKTTYSQKHYPDDKTKTTRYIDVPWVGTAEIALRWKGKLEPDGWHFAPTVVPCSFYKQLEKEWPDKQVTLYPELEGMDVVPNGANIWIQEVATYVFSPRTYLHLHDTTVEVTIADTQTIQTSFGYVEYEMGITSMRLSQEIPVPYRQPISVYIKTSRIGANIIAEAIKDIDCEEAKQRGEVFAIGVKILGYYRMHGEPRSWRELDQREADEKNEQSK